MANRKKLEASGVRAHEAINALMNRLEEHIDDIPSPDSDDFEWGNVGDMGRIIRQLEEILGDHD